MERKFVALFALLAGLCSCTPEAESDRDAAPLVGLWEGTRCHSVETNPAGRRVFARTDVYRAGEVVCEFTPTEVRHYQGGHVRVRARYTRTPTGFHVGEWQGVGVLRVPGDRGEVAIEVLTPTRLVVRQQLPSTDTTVLTSTITYVRAAQTTALTPK